MIRRTRSSHAPRGRSERPQGQALVEFALVLTPLLLILFSIIQLGLLFSTQLGLSTAARETARYASTMLTTDFAQSATNGFTALTDMQDRKLPQYVVGFTQSNLDFTPDPLLLRTRVTYCYYQNAGSPATYSMRVVAKAEYKQVLLLPLISNVIDGIDGLTDSKFRLGAREEMRVEGLLIKKNPADVDSPINPMPQC